MDRDWVLTFLTGALGASVFQTISEYFKNQKNYVREQIDNFYGPIYFCVIRAKANFNHARSIAKASGESFHNEKFAEDSHTQENLKNDVKNTLKIENEYGDAGFAINDEIFEIISSKYSYIDLDDMDVFEKYIKSFERINIEIKKNLNLRTHLSAESYNKHLGDIDALQDSFCKKIEQKFLRKKDKLQDFMTRIIKIILKTYRSIRDCKLVSIIFSIMHLKNILRFLLLSAGLTVP